MSSASGNAGTVDPVSRPGKRISAQRFESNERMIRNVSGESGINVSYRTGKIKIGTSRSSGKSSFAFAGFFTNPDTGAVYMKVKGGYVKYTSRYNSRIADTVEATHPQITGTEANPTRVCLQVDKSTGSACSIVALATEPVDNGTYWYRVIHEAYLNNNGRPVYAWNRLNDWIMGSPIR